MRQDKKHRFMWSSIKLQGNKFAVLQRTPCHDGLGEQPKVDFSDNMDRCGKHVASVRLEVIVGKRGVNVSKGFTTFSTGEVPLQGHKFRPSLKGDAMVDVVVVHVPVRTVSGPTDPTCNSRSIEANLIGKALE